MKKIILFQFLFICATAFSQADTAIIKFINPSTVAAPKGYSHAVQVDLGNCKMLLISGQVALDKQGNLVGKGDLAKQTEQVFTNIKNIIEEVGGSMDDLLIEIEATAIIPKK